MLCQIYVQRKELLAELTKQVERQYSFTFVSMFKGQ